MSGSGRWLILTVGLALGATLTHGWNVRAREAPSIKGVWAFVSETNTETGTVIRDDRTWSGIWVFTARYHCLARMERNRVGLSGAELAKRPIADQVKYYEQLFHYSSTAGTYTLDGNTLTRTWDISQGPEIIGQTSVSKVRVERDRLFVDLPRRTADSGPAVQVVYRRLE